MSRWLVEAEGGMWYLSQEALGNLPSHQLDPSHDMVSSGRRWYTGARQLVCWQLCTRWWWVLVEGLPSKCSTVNYLYERLFHWLSLQSSLRLIVSTAAIADENAISHNGCRGWWFHLQWWLLYFVMPSPGMAIAAHTSISDDGYCGWQCHLWRWLLGLMISSLTMSISADDAISDEWYSVWQCPLQRWVFVADSAVSGGGYCSWWCHLQQWL